MKPPTSGAVSAGSLSAGSITIDGSVIGHTSDSDLITLSSGNVNVAGTLQATGITLGNTALNRFGKVILIRLLI